jgi:hypothetical protein
MPYWYGTVRDYIFCTVSGFNNLKNNINANYATVFLPIYNMRHVRYFLITAKKCLTAFLCPQSLGV